MSSTATTRKDIDDVLGVLNVMMTLIDERFTKIEDENTVTHQLADKIDHKLTA